MQVATTWERSMKEVPALSEQSANRIVAVLSHGHRSSRKTDTSSVKCYACDKKGLYHSSPECPAKDKNCSKCDERGHFAKCCTSTRHRSTSRNRGMRQKANIQHWGWDRRYNHGGDGYQDR